MHPDDNSADYPIDPPGEPADRAAWQAEMQRTPVCPGCGGTGTIMIRVQTRLRSQRFCYNKDEPCPICTGTGTATQADADAWFAREFPEVRETLP